MPNIEFSWQMAWSFEFKLSREGHSLKDFYRRKQDSVSYGCQRMQAKNTENEPKMV